MTLLALCGVAVAQTPQVSGDVDGDGVCSVNDVTALYNYLLYDDTSALVIGDQNGDGLITVADVTWVYNVLLYVSHVDGHEYIDLGLPSGTLWATMNVGASSPEECGDYFAWGETTPKDVYDWSTYQWCEGSENTLTKYCTRSSCGYNGFVDNKTELDPEDDAATVNWGAEWRMPSQEQQYELSNNCTIEWTTLNGVNGCLFTSNINGASLFFPVVGFIWGSSLLAPDSCYYLSRTILSHAPAYACTIAFGSSCTVGSSNTERSDGKVVRAVCVP